MVRIARITRAKRFRRVFAPVAVGLAAAAGTVYTLRRPLPRTNAEIWPGGLAFDVQVIRDRWGVPHLFAANLDDLFFAQGFVHAQDRLWQMELHRRAASGTLSEIFGPTTIAVDRLMRRIGLRRAAQAEEQHLSDEARRVLNAYAAGVNAYLDGNRHRLPVEFSVLRLQPNAWTPIDSLAVGKLLEWSLSANWDTELIRARIVHQIGPERAAELEPDVIAGDPSALPPGVAEARAHTDILEQYRSIAASIGILRSGQVASNAWAVAGARSASGKPLLANDPHVYPQMPCTWYLNHLDAPGFRVIGASLPGTPTVMIGHNDRIAWGFTASWVDTQDLFVERFHPTEPDRYEVDGGWERADRVIEEIAVRGMPEPIREQVFVTRHGPVISPALEDARIGDRVVALSLRSTVLVPGRGLDALLALNRASSWESFRAAFAGWTAPVLSVIYADVDGNVGHQLVGEVPLRGKGDGRLPVPGWLSEYDWRGTIPFDELPSALNPDEKVVVSANERVGGPNYPYHLSHEWPDGFRAQRIREVIGRGQRFTVEDFAALQGDVLSLGAEAVLKHLDNVSPGDVRSRQAVALLRLWDRRVTADSPAAAIYEALRLAILRNGLADLVGSEANHLLGAGVTTAQPLTVYAARGTSLVLHLLNRLDADERRRLVERSLADAVADLSRRLGPDVSRWRWGRLHTVTFQHPLGRVRGLRRLLSRGPYPLGGDFDTVSQSAFDPSRPYAASGWTGTFRQVIDLDDFDRSVATVVPGQSGHPMSRHFADRVAPWRRHESHPLLWSRQAIFAHVEAVLTLRAIRWPADATERDGQNGAGSGRDDN